MPWPTKKLGEVLEYEQPTDYLVSSTEYRDDYPIPVLTAGKSFILGNTNEKSGVFPKGKLPVIIFDDFTTESKFVDFPFKVKSSAMKILHAKKDEADTKFLFYKMQTIKFAHDQHKRYWISGYSKTKIPLPPIAEQRRIVAKIEKLFAKIDEASRLRAESSYASAALLLSALHQIFSRAKKEGWEEKELGSLAKFIDYRGKTPLKTEKGIRLITAKNIKFGFLSVEPREFVDPGIYNSWMTRGIPKKGDVLFTTEAPLGNVAQLDTNEKIVFAQRVIILHPNDKLKSEYLVYTLMSDLMQKRVREKATGTMAKGIRSKYLKTIKIPLPSIADQKKIVAYLDSLSQKSRELQHLQSQTAADFSAFRQSVLHQAFSGE